MLWERSIINPIQVSLSFICLQRVSQHWICQNTRPNTTHKVEAKDRHTEQMFSIYLHMNFVCTLHFIKHMRTNVSIFFPVDWPSSTCHSVNTFLKLLFISIYRDSQLQRAMCHCFVLRILNLPLHLLCFDKFRECRGTLCSQLGSPAQLTVEDAWTPAAESCMCPPQKTGWAFPSWLKRAHKPRLLQLSITSNSWSCN